MKNNPYIEDVTLPLEDSKRLILEIREFKKENEFLKKNSGRSSEGIRLCEYQFI